MSSKSIKSALISVFYKDGIDTIAKLLHQNGVTIYSTGGTQKFIEDLQIPVVAVEDLTGYPSILGGRVKTLHPKVFGGILARRNNEQDIQQLNEYGIPPIDLVIVDLYPFEETLKTTSDESSIIEKIDIGGISLIRAAAKNFNDTLIIASTNEYSFLIDLLNKKGANSDLEDRKFLAGKAFGVSSSYDTLIASWFNGQSIKSLRYGENPHQKGSFIGNLDEIFTQLNGKELSYNNLLDIDACLGLIREFDSPTIAIIKHNNPCGLASDDKLSEAWQKALAGDPVSAFGGVIICNKNIDLETAKQMDSLFFEVLIAPDFNSEALELLKSKKNRVILKLKSIPQNQSLSRTLLNGTIVQDTDWKSVTESDFNYITELKPNQQQIQDLLFANKIVKHTKSNAIVLAKDGQLLGLGCGMVSRLDALNHAIKKAHEFGLNLKGAVMASDAFFPFPDCVAIAKNEGIETVIQPGGSIKDQLSVDFCNENKMAMVFTGHRHFKH